MTYPLLADTHRQLANILGIVDQDFEYDEEGNETFSGSNVTYRATYLIDEEGKVFHESVNDMPLGRNVAEYLRLIDAERVFLYAFLPNLAIHLFCDREQ